MKLKKFILQVLEKNQCQKLDTRRGMGLVKKIGKYQLGRTIGEGTFSKVKLAVNGNNGQKVAIKVKREIRTMKLLHHPNIVRIHETNGADGATVVVADIQKP
ncbi:CBL-interacting serine/threonine-protein kinase 21 [Glycine max]|nr:CBL-interacting serine/threonine-protein kinase 21 [Glycine max]KAH1201333.1 CBL-interacting serine/threonine-protein kinase 21 [Glycine max]